MVTKRTCSVDGCEGVHRAKGLCDPHYTRLKRSRPGYQRAGAPNSGRGLPRLGITTQDRFWRYVDVSAYGCWPWTGCRNDGYGFFKGDSRAVLAHRYAYELLVGPIPDHLCMNKPCVRPDHLEPVTGDENTRRYHRAMRILRVP